MNGCGSFRLGYVGVGFGGNCTCRYGISYAGGGVVFVGLVILTSSPYSSEFLVPGGGWSASGVLLDGRYRPKHVVLLCYKYHHLAIFIVVF